jgi:hypothetical protein
MLKPPYRSVSNLQSLRSVEYAGVRSQLTRATAIEIDSKSGISKWSSGYKVSTTRYLSSEMLPFRCVGDCDSIGVSATTAVFDSFSLATCPAEFSCTALLPVRFVVTPNYVQQSH